MSKYTAILEELYLKKHSKPKHAKTKSIFSNLILLGLICCLIAICCLRLFNQKPTSTSSSTLKTTTLKTKKTTSNQKQQENTVMRTPIDWQQSSQTTPYPDLNQVSNFWVKVSIKKNRTYLMSGNDVIYTMYSTAGAYYTDETTGKKVSYTPTGTFYIQAERGDSFFNNALNEGANNWVSWLHHGEYLFHSVPTLPDGSYNLTAAAKLGKTPDSHGCIRLSVLDSDWMCHNLKVGTKVVIVNN